MRQHDDMIRGTYGGKVDHGCVATLRVWGAELFRGITGVISRVLFRGFRKRRLYYLLLH